MLRKCISTSQLLDLLRYELKLNNVKRWYSSKKKPLFISEEECLEFLAWDPVVQVTEQALMAVSGKPGGEPPCAMMPARSLTKIQDVNGILFTMPGYIQCATIGDQKVNALGCKTVTSFMENEKLQPRLPNIMATILLFDNKTGQLKCVMGGANITASRTAAASVIATKYLRKQDASKKVLALFGAGVQARSHALAMHHCIGFEQIRVWNHQPELAHKFVDDLKKTLKKSCFCAFEKAEDCAKDADVICTCTYAVTPILKLEWLKKNVQINAVGVSVNAHSELDIPVYKACNIFVDSWANANEELVPIKEMGAKILGELGEVLRKKLKVPENSITVYHSMGMAIEDVVTAQLVYDSYCKKHNIT